MITAPSHKALTFREATATLKSMGFTLRNTGFGDYRLNKKGGAEEQAYYTEDLQDAVWTAKNWNGQSL